MPSKQYPTVQPTPLKGTLKDADIIRAIRVAKVARLKGKAQKTRQPLR